MTEHGLDLLTLLIFFILLFFIGLPCCAFTDQTRYYDPDLL